MSNASKGFIKAVLILMVIVATIYIVGYQLWINKDFSDDEDYSKYFDEEPQLQEEELFDKEEAKKMYEMINFKMVQENFGKELFDIYYKNNYKETFTSEFIIYIGIINLNKDKFMIECTNTDEITLEELDKEIKAIFGDIEYKKKSFNLENGTLLIEYIESENIYKITNTKCNGLTFGKDYIETEFIEAKVKDNNIEIYEYAYYVSYSYDDTGNYILNYHKGLNGSTPIIGTSKDVSLNKNKLLKYKYIYEKDESGNYYLIKIEKVEI